MTAWLLTGALVIAGLWILADIASEYDDDGD
jgi:hypothetical protein